MRMGVAIDFGWGTCRGEAPFSSVFHKDGKSKNLFVNWGGKRD